MKYKHLRNITRTKQTVKTITKLNEGPWRWHLGMQGGIATGVSMALFIIAGYPFFGTVASMGALSVLYGTRHLPGQRLLIVFLVGTGLVIVSLFAILCSGHAWLLFAYLIIVAAGSSIITSTSGVGAPGPVMFVLVAAISSRLVIQANQPGAEYFNIYYIPLMIGFGAYLTWLIVAFMSILPFAKTDINDPNLPVLTFRIRWKKEEILGTVRIIAGVAAAILLSKPLGILRVHWVIVAVTAILQAGYGKQLTTVRAFERILGTVAGVLVFEVIHLLNLAGIWIIAAIVLLQFATQVVIARNYVLGLLFITPMALLIVSIGQPGSSYITAKERIIDTILGACLAVIIFWIEEWINRIWMSPLYSRVGRFILHIRPKLKKAKTQSE